MMTLAIGDRVRVKKDFYREGENAAVLDVCGTHPSSLTLIRFDDSESTHWYANYALEPLPKDLAIGTRVRARPSFSTLTYHGVVDEERGIRFVKYDEGGWDVLSRVEILEVLPPEDSEKLPEHPPITGPLPFEENSLDLLDVLIAALDNESLGRVVRALREADLL